MEGHFGLVVSKSFTRSSFLRSGRSKTLHGSTRAWQNYVLYFKWMWFA